MNIWKILNIEKTTDKKLIKKAYHEKLKLTKPEENEKGFMELREAYEKALEYAEGYLYDEYEDADEYDESDVYIYENVDYFEEISEEEQQVSDWWKRVLEIYENYQTRIDVSCWKTLLYNDIPCQVKYYSRCRSMLQYKIVNRNSDWYLPDEVNRLLDDFFDYLGNEVQRSKNDHTEESRWLNKRMKLNENIEFGKLKLTGPVESGAIGRFLKEYTVLVSSIGQSELGKDFEQLRLLQLRYENTAIAYGPYECLHAALQMGQSGQDGTAEVIADLKERFGETAEVQLLEAEYCLYQGKIARAKELLKLLYPQIPPKSYPFAYQMAVCCKSAGMYYEAYQLVKYLTWLRPEPFLFEMADEICDLLETEYEAKEQVTDWDRIAMCRVYLRSSREQEAAKLIEQITSQTKSADSSEAAFSYEYHMARCLCCFNEDEVAEVVPDYEFVKKYPKAQLNVMQRMEWEELQARYLYEQKAYTESIAKCNEILQEYPISYPILLLRSYVDYSYGQYKESMSREHSVGCRKDYKDLDYLISLKPDRVETRLLSAAVMRQPGGNNTNFIVIWYQEALKELEVIKEERPEEYEYCRLKLLCWKKLSTNKKEDYAEVIEGWTKFWTKVMHHPVKTAAKSKYYLMDLQEIYYEAVRTVRSYYCGNSEKRASYLALMEGMQESKYNQPEKYINYARLYLNIGQHNKAETYGLAVFEAARTDIEKSNAADILFSIYNETANVSKAENLMNRLESRESQLAYSEAVAKMHLLKVLKVANYKRAIELLEFVRRESTLTMDGYMMLGMSYKQTNQFEKAKQIYEEAILYVTKCGDLRDNWDDCNFYSELYHLHKKAGKWEEAIRYLNLRDKYTQNDFLKGCYARDYADVYRELLAPYVENGDIDTVESMCKKAPKRCQPYLYYSIATACYNCVNQENSNDKDCTELIEKAIENYKRDISEGECFCASYGALAKLYSRVNDKVAEETILQEGVETAIRNQATADYWGNCNLYEELGYFYYKSFQWRKALDYYELWKKYGENVTELAYARQVAAAYFQFGDFEEAYRLFKCWEESDENVCAKGSLAMSAFGIEEYELAKKHYREYIDENESMWLACLIRIVHCDYMESGQIASDLYHQFEEEYFARQEKLPKDMDDFYYALEDLAWAAGYQDKAEEYNKKAKAVVAENNDSENEDNEQYYCLWRHMYKKEYEAAYQHLVATEYHNGDGEAKAIWQWLRKELRKY